MPDVNTLNIQLLFLHFKYTRETLRIQKRLSNVCKNNLPLKEVREGRLNLLYFVESIDPERKLLK